MSGRMKVVAKLTDCRSQRISGGPPVAWLSNSHTKGVRSRTPAATSRASSCAERHGTNGNFDRFKVSSLQFLVLFFQDWTCGCLFPFQCPANGHDGSWQMIAALWISPRSLADACVPLAVDGQKDCIPM